MNEYRVSCYDCEDETIVVAGSDIPEFCPLCGSDNTEVIVLEEELYEDEEE